MNRTALAVFAAVSTSLAPESALAQAPTAESQPQISATAWVDAHVSPSRAMILVGLSGEGGDAATAAARLHELETAVRSAVGPSTSVVSWGFGMGENQQIRRMLQQDQQITTSRDFLARAGIAVLVEPLEEIPRMATTLTNAGVKAINGVMYFNDDDDPEMQRAIERAVRLARRNAEQLATAEGARLGAVVRLSSNPQFGGNAISRFNWNDQSGVPLQPNEIVIRVMVQGTWELVR